MKNKLFLATSWLAIASALFLIGLVTFWLVYPYKPTEFKSVIVSESRVVSGTYLKYKVDYCKHWDIPATVVRSFVDGIVFTTNSIITNNPVGCYVNNSIILVPQEMASGPYSLRTTWIYKVNPIRDVVITMDSNSFEIIGSDIDRQLDQLN